MGGIIGGLLSAGSSLLGGMLGNEQSAANTQANIAEENFNAGGGNLPSLVANAKAAGLSPLAVLGNTNPGSPVAVGDNSLGKGVADAGQDIGRAVTSYMDPSTKADLALKQAQVDNINADTSSKLARTFAHPGSPPGLPVKVKPDGTLERPYPAYSYYDMGGGHTIRLLSREAAGTQFGPTSLVTGPELLPGLAIHQAQDTGEFMMRPDVVRSIQNVQPPSDSVTGLVFGGGS